MIYAIRHDGDFRTLIELESDRHLQPNMQAVGPRFAHRWVLDERPHETGLWVDADNRIRYATAEG